MAAAAFDPAALAHEEQWFKWSQDMVQHSKANKDGVVGPSDVVQIYALFKQATQGDCPFFPSAEALQKPHALIKHQAWRKLVGLPQAIARARYVALVCRLTSTPIPEFALLQQQPVQPEPRKAHAFYDRLLGAKLTK